VNKIILSGKVIGVGRCKKHQLQGKTPQYGGMTKEEDT
jgi:hypothetical protein